MITPKDIDDMWARLRARRAEAEREKEERKARQDAAEAAFLAEITKNAQTCRAEKVAAQEVQRREEERRAAEAAQQAKEAERRQKLAERERLYCLYWYLYAFLTILPLLIATALIALHDIGWIPLWIMAHAGGACCIFSVFTFLNLAPWIDRKAMKQFRTIFRRRFQEYMLTPYSEMMH